MWVPRYIPIVSDTRPKSDLGLSGCNCVLVGLLDQEVTQKKVGHCKYPSNADHNVKGFL